MPAFNFVEDGSLAKTVGLSVLLGVSTHAAIQPLKLDNRGWRLLFLYTISILLVFVSLVVRARYPIFKAIGHTAAIATAYSVGLFSSILIYRAFFHRLHRFPGPFLAKISRFQASVNAIPLKSFHDTQALHKKYGDFVRVGPREISINRPSAIHTIYESPTKCGRAPWYQHVSDDPRITSVHSTVDLKIHRQRKKDWERGLSFRALTTYVPRVESKVDMLISRLKDSNGRPIDMTELSMFFGFDVMGDVAFSNDFKMLETGTEQYAVKALHGSVAVIGALGAVPWLLHMIGQVPGLTGNYGQFSAWCSEQVKSRRSLLDSEAEKSIVREPQDIMSWLIRSFNENSLNLKDESLNEDARLVVVAGSDTTSAALTNALYYLTKKPACYDKLCRLVRETFSNGDDDWTYEKTKTISYIDFIIYETLRLKPSVPGGMPRLTPPTGIHIDGTFIPGNTIVSVPNYTIQRDPRYWDNALEFTPERWEKLTPEKAPWTAFNRGQWVCPGKNLAMMELRMVLSRIALRFDIEFASDDAELKTFDEDTLDTFTLSLRPLHLSFKSKVEASR